MSNFSTESLFQRLDRLNQVGVSLSRERNVALVLESLVEAAMSITGADGGTLYRVNQDRTALVFDILHSQSMGIRMGGSSGSPIDLPELALKLPNGQPNDTLVAAYAAMHDCTVNIEDVYALPQTGEPIFDFSGTKSFDQRTGYRSKSFLTVPMKNHHGELIGVLQLINATHTETGDVQAFSAADQSLAESLASQASIVLTNRILVEQLEHLFESFVELINNAIDEKSPYTGGHCQRVPTLTMMLAEAAHATKEGPLADFEMTDRDRHELKVAGLLHDCGKITTPVHVVDKATKLQTLYDRIDLIDTRFELLKRDAEIAALRQQLALYETDESIGAADNAIRRSSKASIQKTLAQTMTDIEADRDFLRHNNNGCEAMSAQYQQRVHDIAQQYQWRNPQGSVVPCLTEDEVENLTIRSGTLTRGERKVIDHHIVATINMLETLPWPNHLKNVPEYAGGHHERMDGKGYPKGLTREQMSWQARMMGIADIFEALTAVDRPYKNGMTLSQALAIMRKMRDGGHIDPDLFEVFVRSGLYQRYGELFLEPSQRDAVDIRDLGFEVG